MAECRFGARKRGDTKSTLFVKQHGTVQAGVFGVPRKNGKSCVAPGPGKTGVSPEWEAEVMIQDPFVGVGARSFDPVWGKGVGWTSPSPFVEGVERVMGAGPSARDRVVAQSFDFVLAEMTRENI
ncbi:hypothetical protein CEXT_42211 [Caerostris extrusa]|uniref:Uncharacterized protein n=1 Tax=Caerostris extrusa TaxID=172846 RepID=A0AAV4PTK0_CAEEX|nr:hypothetical protein CEXT_42211 [Caerostris extrusa]